MGSNISKSIMKPFYVLMSVIMLIFNWLDIPIRAMGEPLDLEGYSLVWADEFDGDAIDQTKWRGEQVPLGTEPFLYHINDKGEKLYYHDSLLKVENGFLTQSIQYISGRDDMPEGWYSFPLNTAGLAEFTYGYFECRAKLSKSSAANCAFWMNSAGCTDPAVPHEEAVEIDIFESMHYNRENHGCIERNMHYFDETGHQRLHAKFFKVGGNPYEEFNTYGVKWDKDGYTFYINGREATHTTFGRCHGQLYLCLCNYIRSTNDISIDGDSADFVVDYVRVYQQTQA